MTQEKVSANGQQHVPEYHLAGKKRLEAALADYSLTMQHALRNNLEQDLLYRSQQEAGVLPAFSAAEMFDYLVDSDDEFFNWCFPFCAYRLTKASISYLHTKILNDFRASLQHIPSDSEPSKEN